MTVTGFFYHAILTGSLAIASNLQAQTATQIQAPPNVDAVTAQTEPSDQAEPNKPSDSMFAASAVSDDVLQAAAGREDVVQISQAEQNAAVSRNSVGDQVVTGTAQISGNAFQNMSGLSILNVNTGNNVAINAAMNVNVSLNPGP